MASGRRSVICRVHCCVEVAPNYMWDLQYSSGELTKVLFAGIVRCIDISDHKIPVSYTDMCREKTTLIIGVYREDFAGEIFMDQDNDPCFASNCIGNPGLCLPRASSYDENLGMTGGFPWRRAMSVLGL